MVADLLASFGTIWATRFPGCNKRAHWHLANLLKFEAPSGLPFVRLEGYLKYCIGTDRDTAKARLDEFYSRRFVDYQDDDLNARTAIIPTPKFFQTFSQYYQNVAIALCKEAAATSLNEDVVLNARMEEAIYAMMQSLNRHIRCGTDNYIFSRMKSNMDLAMKAQIAMLRRGHWVIFMAMWLHDADNSEDKIVTFNDLFGAACLQKLEESPETVENYVTDLVSWGFLQRVGKSKYSLNMDARKHFSDVFSTASHFAHEAAAQLQALKTGEVVVLRPGTRKEQR